MIKPTTVLGQPAMHLRAPDGAQATVLLHGAHIVSWIPAGDQERLYLSPDALAGPGQSVRGGVPVIFPQFNAQGRLPRHGFARDRAWTWVEGAIRSDAAIGVLRLTDDAATRAIWPHGFETELTLSLSGLGLDIELAVTNTGATALAFQAALHSYFLLDDLRRARLHGLFGSRYHDALSGVEQHQEMDPQGFVGEIDRIYFDVTQPLSLATAMGRMALQTEGFPDRVVWNPGPTQTAALADMPADDWLRMLCVEAGVIGQPITLAPGQEWSARLSLVVA